MKRLLLADNDDLDLVEKYRSFQQRQNQIIEGVKSRRTHSHPYHPQYLENLRKQKKEPLPINKKFPDFDNLLEKLNYALPHLVIGSKTNLSSFVPMYQTIKLIYGFTEAGFVDIEEVAEMLNLSTKKILDLEKSSLEYIELNLDESEDFNSKEISTIFKFILNR